MSQWFQSNITFKLIALALAVITWFYVKGMN